MAIVAALVDGAGQGEDPGPDGVSEASPGGAAAVAMSQGGEALPAEFGKEPTHMPQREAQELGGCLGRQDSGLDAGEDVCALLFLRGQSDRLPVHSPRVTESLSSWRVTESWSIYKTTQTPVVGQ